MEKPNKTDLIKYISNSFGKDIKLFSNENLTNPASNEFLWVKKYKDKYLVATLDFKGPFNCETCEKNTVWFIIYIYNSKEELQKGIKYIYGGQYSGRIRYFEEKFIETL